MQHQPTDRQGLSMNVNLEGVTLLLNVVLNMNSNLQTVDYRTKSVRTSLLTNLSDNGKVAAG